MYIHECLLIVDFDKDIFMSLRVFLTWLIDMKRFFFVKKLTLSRPWLLLTSGFLILKNVPKCWFGHPTCFGYLSDLVLKSNSGLLHLHHTSLELILRVPLNTWNQLHLFNLLHLSQITREEITAGKWITFELKSWKLKIENGYNSQMGSDTP